MSKTIITPMILETVGSSKTMMDVYTKLFEERVIVLSGSIDHDTAREICAQLLILESRAPDKDITLYITSPGGSIPAGLAIYDTMQLVSCNVNTIVIGYAYSMGAVIASGGDHRMILQQSKIMVHQASGSISGKSEDIVIQMHELEWWQDKAFKLLAKDSGKSYDEIVKLCERDRFMDAEEAISHNFIDEIISTRKMSHVTRVVTPKDITVSSLKLEEKA